MMQVREMEMRGYRVFEFQNGHVCRCRGGWRSDAHALACIRKDGLLAEGASEIVETQLIVRPRPPSSRRLLKKNLVTHSLAHLEQIQPDTVFIAAIEHEAFKRECRAVEAAWDNAESELKERIRAAVSKSRTGIRFEDIPENRRKHIRIHKSGCWIWTTSKDKGPYRQMYLKHKGMIPKGALLRHTCDNRRCVNLNHLIPGTHRDNMLDMWERGRACWQRSGRIKLPYTRT